MVFMIFMVSVCRLTFARITTTGVATATTAATATLARITSTSLATPATTAPATTLARVAATGLATTAIVARARFRALTNFTPADTRCALALDARLGDELNGLGARVAQTDDSEFALSCKVASKTGNGTLNHDLEVSGYFRLEYNWGHRESRVTIDGVDGENRLRRRRCTDNKVAS